jgi:hypothetical protein
VLSRVLRGTESTMNSVCIVYVNWTRRRGLRRAVMCVVMASDSAKYEKTKLLHSVGNEQYDVLSHVLEILALNLGGHNTFEYKMHLNNA